LIRRHCYKLAGYKCEICGGKGRAHPVEAHEVWYYDDKKRQQVLVGIQALCPDCHGVKHAGFSILRGRRAQVLAKLRAVNTWANQQAVDYMIDCFTLHVERSKLKWSVKIEWVHELIKELKEGKS
jgi:5-methylcytosine-specific restriction endonuclease McrA